MAATSFQARTLQTGSIEIHYVVGGEGPLLVLSYALGPPAWANLDALARRCRVAVMDPRRTRAPPRRMAYDWLGQLAEVEGLDGLVLATWSLGAPAALRYAAGQPDCLSGIVLVDPAGFRPRLRPIPRPSSPTKEELRVMVRSMWRSWVRSPSVDTSELEDIHYEMLSNPQTYESDSRYNAAAATQVMFDGLDRIVVPALLLAGRHSNVFGPECAETTGPRFGNATIVVFEHSAHALQLEEPEMFAQVVADFVAAMAERPPKSLSGL